MFIQLAHGLRAHFLLAIFSLACFAFLCRVSEAHVQLDSPNGGETLSGGSAFTIEWQVAVGHNQLDWDLWYSTESNNGPWLEIATDLPAGDTSSNSLHSFDWSTPNSDISSAWVRVRQDNMGQDYFSISESSFSITAVLGGADFTGNGNVDAEDLAIWESGFGTPSGALPSNGDADLDADVDGTDFLVWQNEFSGAGAALEVQTVPEPSTAFALLAGMVLFLWQRR